MKLRIWAQTAQMLIIQILRPVWQRHICFRTGAKGIFVCGSGIGISIAANRFSHIRAALVTDVTAARLSRQHNDSNVLALGERLTGIATALIALMRF